MITKKEETQFIIYDFNLPNHSKELNKAESFLERIKNKIRKIQDTRIMSENTYFKLYGDTIRGLDYVGALSIKVLQLDEKIEKMYSVHIVSFPELSKFLWFDHYKELNKPYSSIKNKCYIMLDELNELYFNIYGKKSVNDFGSDFKDPIEKEIKDFDNEPEDDFI